MKLIDLDGKILDEKAIEKLSHTIEGKCKIKELLLAAKVGYSAHQLFGFLKNELKILNREPTYEERDTFCNVLWYSLFKVDQSEVDLYVEECVRHLQEHDYQFPQVVGNA